MKTKLLLALFVFTLSPFKIYSQFSFGASSGIGFNGAYFGYKVNEKTVPYIGFQYLNAKFQYKQSGEKFDWELDRIVSYSDMTELSVNVYIPNLGVKYFIKEQEKLKAYLSLSLSKPFLTGKLEHDEEEAEDFRESIEKISLFGGEFGFGVEYFFDENFSIGGEIGIRYMRLKYNDSYDREVYDPNTGISRQTEIMQDFEFRTNPTFSKISLNYYF